MAAMITLAGQLQSGPPAAACWPQMYLWLQCGVLLSLLPGSDSRTPRICEYDVMTRPLPAKTN